MKEVPDGAERKVAFDQASAQTERGTRMAASNKVILAGNITRDPELRFTQEGTPVVNFGLAVNRVRSKNKDAADYFNVVAWQGLAETIANYKKKGDGVLIEGRLQYSSWEGEDGARRSKVDVVAENVQFLSMTIGGPSASARSAGDAAGDEEDPDDLPL
jgi:single-strand DNA-binding protein